MTTCIKHLLNNNTTGMIICFACNRSFPNSEQGEDRKKNLLAVFSWTIKRILAYKRQLSLRPSVEGKPLGYMATRLRYKSILTKKKVEIFWKSLFIVLPSRDVQY